MRKHHNRLYYSQYTNKSKFKMQWANMLYPTTDENLQAYIDGKQFNSWTKTEQWKNISDVVRLAKFILNNRNKIKFRIQQKHSFFYSNSDTAKKLQEEFKDDFVGQTVVEPKLTKADKNTIGCVRLPHGKYRYQVHLKNDAHKYLTDEQRQGLFEFLDLNVNNCLVTSKYVLDYLEGKFPHCYHGYFYVKNEKFLSPVYMLAQKAIYKVIRYKRIKNGSNQKTTKR